MSKRPQFSAVLGAGEIPSQSVLWSGVANLLSNAMKPEVGLAGAIAAINPVIAGPVIALAVVCGVCRHLSNQRDAVADKTFRDQIARLVGRAADGRDVLQDIVDGTTPLNVEVDDFVKTDIADFVDAQLGEQSSRLRAGLRQEIESVLLLHPQFEQVRADLEILRVLAWINNDRGRRLETRIRAIESGLAAHHAKNDPRLGIALKVGRSRFFGHPVGALQHEPAWRPDLLPPDQALLVYGPPRVGKSCWVLRAAIEWLMQSDGEHHDVLYFNATERKADELLEHVAKCKNARSVLIIIDDFHFGNDLDKHAWIDAVHDAHTQRATQGWETCPWFISRGEDDYRYLALLSGIVTQPGPLPYPIDRVVEMFLCEGATKTFSKQQMFIAALASRLDPALPRMLDGSSFGSQYREGGLSQWDIVREAVEDAERRASDDWLGYVQQQGVLSSYKLCLPLASLDLAADYSFYADLAPESFASDIIQMRREGFALQDRDDRVKLLEHPFQVRRTLAHLASRGERVPFAGARDLYGREFCRAPLAAMVVGAFILHEDHNGQQVDSATMIRRLVTLQDHSEWTGFRDVLADALDEVCGREAIWKLVPEEVRPAVRESALKVRRLVSQDASTLELQRKEWEQRLDAIHRGTDTVGRIDHVLYEIGYIDYLLGDRDKAIEVLDESVITGVQCVKDNLSAPAAVGSKKWIRGWMALANVWVTYLVREKADFERDALSDNPTRVWKESTPRAGRLFVLLNQANSVDMGSAQFYGEALDLICPGAAVSNWSSVNIERPQTPDEADVSEAAGWLRRVLRTLGDKELQCWYDWKEFEWWPWIFGLDTPPNCVVPESLQFSPLVRSRSAIASQVRMFRACATYVAGDEEQSRTALSEAIAACLQYLATGRIEELGTYLAAVYQMSRQREPAWGDAAEWAIQRLAPPTGHAELARRCIEGSK